MLTSAVATAGSGATGAACVFPDMAAKIKPATAIANSVRNMFLSLFRALRDNESACEFANLPVSRSSWT
jgi:hypothetical protein